MHRRPALCVVVSSELTVRCCLRDQLMALSRECALTVVVNTTNPGFLDDLGIDARLERIAITRPISPKHDLLALKALVRLFRRERFAAVHSVTPKAGLLAMLAARTARIPERVHMFTGQVWASKRAPQRQFLKSFDRMIVGSSTRVLVDGPAQLAFLVDEGVVRRERAHVLANGSMCGVDVDRFRPDSRARDRIRAELGIARAARVLLFVGRLSRDKGVLDLAAAFPKLVTATNELHLVFVGGDEGDLRAQIERRCRIYRGRLHFVDFTSEPEAFMAAADVLCLPSYREGLPNAPLEAGAVGLPTVAARVRGATDAVVDARTGLLHEPRDAIDLARCLRTLLDDDALRRRMGAAARARISRDFTRAGITRAFVAFYRELLDLPVDVDDDIRTTQFGACVDSEPMKKVIVA